MKNISTGFGLCVLGLAMAAWSVLERLGASANASAAAAAMPAVAPCDARFEATPSVPECPEEPMFAPTPRVIGRSCGLAYPIGGIQATDWTGPSVQPLAADVDGDGQVEYFTYGEWRVIYGGTPRPITPLLLESRVIPAGQQGVVEEQIPVLSTAGLAQLWIDTMGGGIHDVHAYPIGWRDFDGDGDLDLSVLIRNVSVGSSLNVWFENIARPATPRLAADINGDGQVDGADLGLVLLSWGLNP